MAEARSMDRQTRNMKPIVAAAHATAPLFDLPGGIAKAIELIAEASRSGARLVVFPESSSRAFRFGAGSIVPSMPIVSSAVLRKAR